MKSRLVRGRVVTLCSFIAYLALSSLSTNAAAAVVIDFGTGLAGPGGTITESSGDVIGTGILIGSLTVQGTSSDGTYVVTNGILSFNTAADTISISGSVGGLGVGATTLLSGSFSSFSYTAIPGPGGSMTEIFTGQGPDTKSSDLLTALGIATNTPFDFFGFSIESVNGTVVSTDVVNTAVPVPAAVWLFGTGLLGMIGISRPRKAA
jgi:hypothetical protein